MAIGRVPGQTGIQPSIVTAKGDLIVATASGSVTNQSVGSNNQVLTADSAQADGVKWANGSAATLTTTGDILYASAANTPARLGIGSSSQVLTVSGGVPAWATPAGGSLTPYCSVNANATNITDNVATEAVFSNENFDSDNAYNTSTGRFTPQTAGKYFVTATIMVNANGAGIWHQGTVSLRKNGSEFARCDADFYISYAPYNLPQTVSGIIDCNGTTDYISTFVTLNVTSGGTPQYGAASRMVIYKIGA
jgi:hypothetical protein